MNEERISRIIAATRARAIRRRARSFFSKAFFLSPHQAWLHLCTICGPETDMGGHEFLPPIDSCVTKLNSRINSPFHCNYGQCDSALYSALSAHSKAHWANSIAVHFGRIPMSMAADSIFFVRQSTGVRSAPASGGNTRFRNRRRPVIDAARFIHRQSVEPLTCIDGSRSRW